MIPLGHGSVPTSSADLQERIAEGIRVAIGATTADGILVGASLESAERLPLVATTLTHVVANSVPSLPDESLPAVGTAVLDEWRIEAEALQFRGVPIDISATATEVPVSWRQAADGLWLVPEKDARAGLAPKGDAQISVSIGALETAVHTELANEVERRGFSLKSFDMQVKALGVNTVGLTSSATVGKAFLKATVTVSAHATIDDSLTLLIDDVHVASPNPLVSAFIGPLESRVAPWNGRRIDLTSYSFAGARLTEAELTADSAVRLRVHAGRRQVPARALAGASVTQGLRGSTGDASTSARV